MTKVDCSELTSDEQLALAGAITDALEGKGVALVKGKMVVIDELSGQGADEKTVESAVKAFLSQRKNSDLYSMERHGDTIVVYSPDPVAAQRSRRRPDVPPNLMKCPFCAFVTPYEEAYVVHYRSHLFGV